MNYKRYALIIIDMQNDFVLPGAASEHNGVAGGNDRARANGGGIIQVAAANVGTRSDERVSITRRIGETGIDAEKGIAESSRVVSACNTAEEGVVETGRVGVSRQITNEDILLSRGGLDPGMVAEKRIARSRRVCHAGILTKEGVEAPRCV